MSLQLSAFAKIARRVATHPSLTRDYDKAVAALEYLERNQFEATSVLASVRFPPVIKINATGNLELLKRKHNGYIYMRRTGDSGVELVWRAVVKGCRVEWVEIGGRP